MRTKVLIIERNPAIGGIWRDLLEKENYDVKLHVEKVHHRKAVTTWGTPDIVVSGLESGDHVIPTGREVCERFFDRVPNSKLLPLIQILSGVPQSTRSEPTSGAAFDVLRKPIKPIDLLVAVRSADFQQLQNRLFRKSPPMIAANLRGQELSAICQRLSDEKSTGALLVESACREAVAWFDAGRAIDAVSGLLIGEEAMLEILVESSGRARFFESSVRGVRRDPMIPETKILVSIAARMRADMEHAERALAPPNLLIRRNEDKVVSDAAIFSERVYIILERPKTLEELRHELGALTHRQLLVALHGMMARKEIIIERLNPKQTDLNPEVCARIAKGITSDKRATRFRLPIDVGVVSFPTSAARHFLGTLSGSGMSGQVLLESERDVLTLSQFDWGGGLSEFQRHAGIILILTREDTRALPRVLDFVDELKRSHVKAFTVAVVTAPGVDASYTTSCAGLLKVTDPDVRFVPFFWDKASCLNVLKAFLASMFE